MPAHMEHVFSAAFERELAGADRAAFETHLAECQECHTGYEEFSTSIAALRALPRASMPVTVVLPSSPPVAAREGIASRIRSLSTRIRVGGTALGAAVAAALVIFSMQTSHSVGLSTAAPNNNSKGGVEAPVAGINDSVAPPPGALPQALSSSACAATTVHTASTTVPTGFNNSVSVSDPAHPGQKIVVATTGAHFAAGDTILVFARLSQPATISQPEGGTATPATDVSTPCVAIAPGSESRSSGGTASSPSFFGADVQPTSDVSSGGVPLQSITLPRGLAHGSTVTLYAFVPGSVGNPAFTATLVLTID